jgi:ferredoxin
MGIYAFSFSPTGTSAKILRAVSSGVAEGLNTDVTSVDLTFNPADDIELTERDIVIAGAPVYGGKIAPLAKLRLNALRGNGAKCIVVAIYGNRAFENAASDLAGFMAEGGCLICGAAAFVGEHSYSTSATPIAAGRPDGQDLSDAHKFGMEIASLILQDKLREVNPTELSDVPSPAESIANFRKFVVAYQQQQSTNPVTYLPTVDQSLCDGCGACYAACPTGAINPECEEVDPAKCIKCCACVKVCPQEARHLATPFAGILSENFNLRKSPRWIL